MKKYLECSECGTEINPNVWDGCEKYYNVGGEIMCEDCFREWAIEWVQDNLEEMARLLNVPVVEV